jgi:hypothetical protein
MFAYQLFPDGEWYCVAHGTLEECIAKCDKIKEREPNAVIELDDQVPRGRSI